MPKPGDTIDRYQVESLLGEGAMGAVYRAHDMRLNRPVAIKVLRVSAGAGAAAGAARLLREARNVASFSHPNAVTIFDVGEVDGSPYIAMELVVGRTLREYRARDAAPWRRKVRWMVDAARTLGAAHKQGLFHRDVKPDNVMVRDEGGVKVLDFGIARRAAPTASPANATREAPGNSQRPPVTGRHRAVMGSPMYMPPEQFDGGATDGRSDQFSWAVTTYYLLAGKSPWGETTNMTELVSAIMLNEPESLRAVVPELPAGVDDAILRAMRKLPGDRFESMEHAADAIERALDEGAAVAAKAVPVVQERAPAVVVAARGGMGRATQGAVGVALVAVGVLLGVLYARSVAAPARAPDCGEGATNR